MYHESDMFTQSGANPVVGDLHSEHGVCYALYHLTYRSPRNLTTNLALIGQIRTQTLEFLLSPHLPHATLPSVFYLCSNDRNLAEKNTHIYIGESNVFLNM